MASHMPLVKLKVWWDHIFFRKPHVEPMLHFKVECYTNFFFKAKLNSCHPTQRAVSELLQKRELQRSSSHALISTGFVFQAEGRKAGKYSQIHRSKQWYQWWIFSVFKKLSAVAHVAHLSSCRSSPLRRFFRGCTKSSSESSVSSGFSFSLWVFGCTGNFLSG